MPIALPSVTAALTAGILGSGNIGMGVPKLALGVAIGLTQWVPTIIVQTTDAGSLGVGKGVPIPVVVTQPILYANLLAGSAANGLSGIMNPILCLGLANGLVVAFSQMLLNTQHVGVGVGSGVARFQAPAATGAMLSGFAAADMKGEGAQKKARAVAQGLDQTFASLLLPIAIAGSASPTGGSGVGIGNII